MNFSTFFSLFSLQLLGAAAVSMFIFGGSLQKLTRTFNAACRKKEDPDFPITFDEVNDAVREQPNLAPFIVFRATRQRLRLIWQHHQDEELEQLAKRIRKRILTIAVLWGLELAVFLGIVVWKTLF